MTIVLSNCKMIESLVLHKCWNLSHFEIGSEALSLKRLVVDKCSFRNALFKVSAPNLCFFKYFGKLCFFEMKNTLAIEEAHLHFYLGYDNVGTGARVMYDLVKDLYNARVLTVSPYLIQVYIFRSTFLFYSIYSFVLVIIIDKLDDAYLLFFLV